MKSFLRILFLVSASFSQNFACGEMLRGRILRTMEEKGFAFCLNKKATKCIAKIFRKWPVEAENMDIVTVQEGGFMTTDYDQNRIVISVDSDDIVVTIPTIG
uniref:Uncharacterized protein n=1 Tax=Corethron hystrix TaxID=216773 RepID=A0A7S1BBV9_9STRA|mmetsp:Transcript_21053/g.47727  ORF Transcript_21053/g.47727 Transcript_21053/m.47727 type:complete len:102 (+) Transcript_21053:215-520(+)